MYYLTSWSEILWNGKVSPEAILPTSFGICGILGSDYHCVESVYIWSYSDPYFIYSLQTNKTLK